MCEVEEGGEEGGGGGGVALLTRVTLEWSVVEELDEPVREVVWSAMCCEVRVWDAVAGFLVKSPNESRKLPISPNDPRPLVRSERRLLPSV